MSDTRTGWWYDVNAIFDAGLSEHALVVRFFLARCADKGGRSWPAVVTIAARCNISRSTVVRALRELIDKGWLSRESRYRPESKGKETSIYSLRYPGLQTSSHKFDTSVPTEPTLVPTEPTLGSHRTREGNPIKEITTTRLSESEPTWGPGDIDRQASWVRAQIKKLGHSITKKACCDLFAHNGLLPEDIRQAVLQTKTQVEQGYQLTNPYGFLLTLAKNIAEKRWYKESTLMDEERRYQESALSLTSDRAIRRGVPAERLREGGKRYA